MVVMVLLAGPGWAQTTANRAPADPLASLKTGQWIRLEGTVRGGASAWCTGLRQLAGDFLDDDWSLRGPVQSVDPVKQEFLIAGCRVVVTEDTSYEGKPRESLTGIQDVRPGMVLDIEGTFVADRGLVSAEVDDESDEVAGKPHLKDRIEIVGRIQRVDTRSRLVTVMGIEFQITDKTKMRSAIK